MCVHASVMSDSATLQTIAHQASLSVGFPRQEYWSKVPFPHPGHLSDPGIEPASLTTSSCIGRWVLSGVAMGRLQSAGLVIVTHGHSFLVAGGIPWTEEPGGLLSMGSHRVRHD